MGKSTRDALVVANEIEVLEVDTLIYANRLVCSDAAKPGKLDIIELSARSLADHQFTACRFHDILTLAT